MSDEAVEAYGADYSGDEPEYAGIDDSMAGFFSANVWLGRG